ncbi:MAG: hypothetical protein IJD01_01620 [Clostridia bacterium]|nr:hypothetical protein [Clostridia bacterium]
MTVAALIERLSLETVTVADPDREVTGGYAGDLLSWVMGRASEGDAWVTIMTNINVVAVASLSDVACVVLCENVPVEEDVIATATARGVTLLRTEKPTFEMCAAIADALNGASV